MTPALVFANAAPAAVRSRLDRNSIHVWRFPYAASAGRAPFRALLGVYMRVPAATVPLVAGANGKPALEHRSADRDALDFNWSHSRGQALMALARGTMVGVDIERLAHGRRQLDLARRFFAPTEADTLAGLEPEARTHAFTGLWCAKEAVLKCAGAGLAFGLERVVFTWRGEADWELLRVDPELGHTNDWHLATFTAIAGYRGALAWRGKGRQIETWEPAADALSSVTELGGGIAVPDVRASLP